MPDVLGKTLNEAEKILKESGLESVIDNETEELDKNSATVSNQIPQAGITVNKGSKVYLQSQ